MKLKSFRIKNYKSIKDSRECYLSNAITVLAGKNESGKTSILEALEDFSTGKKIRKEAIPIHNSELKPEIIVTFEVDEDEFKKISPYLVVDKKKTDITLSKEYYNAYTLINSEELFSKTIKANEKRTNDFEKQANSLISFFKDHQINITLDVLNEKNFSQVSSQFSNLKQNIEAYSSKLAADEKEKVLEIIATLKQIIDEFSNLRNFDSKFLDEFKRHIPNFILFDTYNDQIPNNVPITQLQNNTFISDLVTISDLDIKLIKDPSLSRENLKHKDKVNIKVSEEYEKFWAQDAANLYLDWDKENLLLWIKEDGEYYEPKQRSKGKQWHLAFYVRVTARSKEEVPNIILIDEPGLFLHARAQKDILRKLEECSTKVSIIFSTHSPYLIDPNNLIRVRLVERTKEKGTEINKIHAKADKETLTPILTAIGEDLSQGIRVDKKNSFVVEGISDYYYIHAFKKLLGFDQDINMVPGCGDNIPAVASILFGWGLDPYFILDSDKPRLVNQLKTKLDISENVILKISEENGKTIEELFSDEDFKKHILEDETADLSEGIAKYLKNNKVGKELPAKKFSEKVNSGKIKKEDLSESTLKNIKNLFDKISILLSETNGKN